MLVGLYPRERREIKRQSGKQRGIMTNVTKSDPILGLGTCVYPSSYDIAYLKQRLHETISY